jgi:FAD/FMN-containing dehydrogenase
MVDLSLLNTVTVDPAARRARVGGGALLADLDAATQAHGLAVPAGLVSHTGVGGLTLGGGMGWLTRKFGLSIDNLVSAEVVTADARVLRAAADEHPDLFWAIRGGGGNFGVVTCFEFELHEVDPMVQFGMFFWPVDQGPEVLRLTREITAWVSRKNSPQSALLIYRLDGAFSRVGDDQTAFGGGRSPRYGAFIEGVTADAGLLAAERGWVRGFWEALRPHALGSGAGYINGAAEYSGDAVRGSYGAATYERLARIKAEYDPDNTFHLNASIPPAAGPDRPV